MERFQEEMHPITTPPDHYPGYPTEKLTLNIQPSESLQDIDLPAGPWEMNSSPLPTLEEVRSFENKGLETDALGRPLHPWAHMLLSDRGVITGKGAYWHWGPNATADPIVITNEARPRILLITRSDTGMLALPGGFIDKDEQPLESARRELLEETGLELDSTATLVYQGPVADLRTTLHAWAETSAYLFTVPKPSAVQGQDDAVNADWYYIDELSDTLFGSHAMLVETALKQRDVPRTLESILSAPAHETQKNIISAGHMAYDHYTIQHGEHTAFVKEHDAMRFTDPIREHHSRAYLQKEQALYEHLRDHSFGAIPDQTKLVDGSLLAMNYLSPEDGWHWRAPADASQRYIRDVLDALTALQAAPPLAYPKFHAVISPTYETFWSEGWDAIDETNQQNILEKVQLFAQNWDADMQSVTRMLVSEFPALYTSAQSLDRTLPTTLAHNDARQSNIAWHPENGVRIVDWSWADEAPINADATMFLIDMVKSGYSIDGFEGYVNKEFAHTLMGFWLAHSIWETRDGSSTVREHQVASAIAAYQLLKNS